MVTNPVKVAVAAALFIIKEPLFVVVVATDNVPALLEVTTPVAAIANDAPNVELPPVILIVPSNVIATAPLVVMFAGNVIAAVPVYVPTPRRTVFTVKIPPAELVKPAFN